MIILIRFWCEESNSIGKWPVTSGQLSEQVGMGVIIKRIKNLVLQFVWLSKGQIDLSQI